MLEATKQVMTRSLLSSTACLLASSLLFAAAPQPEAFLESQSPIRLPATQPTTAPVAIDLASLLTGAQMRERRKVPGAVPVETGLASMCKEHGFVDIVRTREERMRKLQEMLSELPEDVRIECVAVDTLYGGGSSSRTSNSVLLHYVEPASPHYDQRMRELGSVGLNQIEWEFLRPFMRTLTTLRQPREDVWRPGTADAAVVCFYDGQRWNAQVWQDMVHLLETHQFERVGVQEFGRFMLMVHRFLFPHPGKRLQDERYAHPGQWGVMDEYERFEKSRK